MLRKNTFKTLKGLKSKKKNPRARNTVKFRTSTVELFICFLNQNNNSFNLVDVYSLGAATF